MNNIDTYFGTELWLKFKTIFLDFKNVDHLEDAKEFYCLNEKAIHYHMLWAEFWDCLDCAMQYYENYASFKQEVQGDI